MSAVLTGIGIVLAGSSVGVLSMLLYARMSPQARVAQLSSEIAEARSALRCLDEDDLRVVWSLTRHALGLSLQQIKLILVPTLCAGSLVLGLAWIADSVFGLSEFTWANRWHPSWSCSGHVAFWIPLTGAALAAKVLLKIK